MAGSKIDQAVENVREKDLKNLHKEIKRKKKRDPLGFFKTLTIVFFVLAVISIFVFWKFNIIGIHTSNPYGGKPRVHLLSYCSIWKLGCQTSKLENGSIILTLRNNFNEEIDVEEVSFGDCSAKVDVPLEAKDETTILAFCENYEDVEVTYERSSGLIHRSSGTIFFFVDMTNIFGFLYN